MSDSVIYLEINILSYWHAGSGFGRGADVDALVLKDCMGLPYLPGRTVKGLLREGVQSCEDAGIFPVGRACELFGAPAKNGKPEGSIPGTLSVHDARLPDAEREWLSSASGKSNGAALYDAVASTSLDKSGMAQDRTLRTIELCIPLMLATEICGPSGDWVQDLQKACTLIRSLGSHRHRGLGRCALRIREGGACHV